MTDTLLPELVAVTCTACSGEGCVPHAATNADTYAEYEQVCEVCGGSGELEICSGCYELPRLEDGLEVCGCVALTLKQAA